MRSRIPARTLTLAAALLAAAVSDSASSGHLPIAEHFYFANPGVTLAKNGIGLEMSGGLAQEAALAGVLVRYEPGDNTFQMGLEAGLALLQMEIGASVSARGTEGFLAPDLCVPLPLSSRRWIVANGFYRIYPARASANTLGFSLKIPLLPGPI